MRTGTTVGDSSTSSIAPSHRSSAMPAVDASLLRQLQRPSGGTRSYACMFPDFLDLNVDEIHVEMASREFAELELIGEIARHKDVAVGIIDVKSYYIETIDDVADRVRRCLQFAPAERLSFAPDCGLSQTARWAAQPEAAEHGRGVQLVRQELGL